MNSNLLMLRPPHNAGAAGWQERASGAAKPPGVQ
jgi:hypothetical protein